MMDDILSLAIIGRKAYCVTVAVLNILETLDPLTEGDLDRFEAYLSKYEDSLSIADPTTYLEVSQYLPLARARIDLARAAVRYRDRYGSSPEQFSDSMQARGGD